MSAYPFRRVLRNALGCALIGPGALMCRWGVRAMYPPDRPPDPHDGDSCEDTERWLEDAHGDLNDVRMALVRALGGARTFTGAPGRSTVELVKLLRDDRDAARNGVAP